MRKPGFLDDAECPAWCLHEPMLTDAQDAAETLDELLAEFPLVGPADEAVAVAAILTANGNSVAIAADLTRRTMLCSLDAKMERPEQRRFKADPLAMVRADRAKYVSAALTILRAYHVVGRPEMCDPLGSFDAWSGWVRGAVVWLEYADPVDSQAAVRVIDPRGAELAAVPG